MTVNWLESKENVVEHAVPEEGETAFTKQRPATREPVEQVAHS